MEEGAEINALLEVFKNTFPEVSDFDRLNNYFITFHSTALEGSNLSMDETRALISRGVIPAKPKVHQYMVLDHHTALLETLKLADAKSVVTVKFIQAIAAMVMKNTGAVITTALGSFDTSKGDLRLNNVSASNTYFVNYTKIEPLLAALVTKIQRDILAANTPSVILDLAFTAHFGLASIHPFADGNGRTSRLLMNFIQRYHGLPISPVFSTDQLGYYSALQSSRTENSLTPFLSFMRDQYVQYLRMLLS